jgi:hypothetical protein
MLKRSVDLGVSDVDVVVGCAVDIVVAAGRDVVTTPSVADVTVASGPEHAPRVSNTNTNSTAIRLPLGAGDPVSDLATGRA